MYRPIVEQVQKIKSRKIWFTILFVPDLETNEIPKYYNEPENFFGYKKCVSPWYQLDVMPNGDTVTCKDFPDFVTGNIKESSVFEIYNSEKHRKFRLSSSKLRERRLPNLLPMLRLNGLLK